jgi:hypothetical protein
MSYPPIMWMEARSAFQPRPFSFHSAAIVVSQHYTKRCIAGYIQHYIL